MDRTRNSTLFWSKKERYVGSIFCRTSSTGKLAFLNNMVGIFEYEADENGISRGKMWEWK
jgi:hypothetical protein